ncbi:FAD dependent oxidoreductase, partial [Pannonibacter indicus]
CRPRWRHDHHCTNNQIGPVRGGRSDIAPVREALTGTLRGAERYRIIEEKICYYTVSADERFVSEPLGKSGWLLSACSGHGFKLGPLMGLGVADALTGKRAAEDVSRWAAGLGGV